MAIALILAAGSGERFGAKEPKALVELAGRPLLQWSVDVLREVVGIERSWLHCRQACRRRWAPPA